MTGRILIAEATVEQRILLRAKLASAFYTVITAETGADALRLAKDAAPDLVIAGSTLPEMCGSTLCTELRALPGHRETPLVLLCERDDPEERLALLALGADDVIPRRDSELLFARLRNLLAQAQARDELRQHEATQQALGLSEPPTRFGRPPRITLLPLTEDSALDALTGQLRISLEAQIRRAEPARLLAARRPLAEAVVLIDTGSDAGSGLALLSQLRMARHGPPGCLVYVTGPNRSDIAARALDLGADDVLSGGLDPLELTLRLPRLINRARRLKRHRVALRNGMRAAITDPLTGLHNRRYALPELARMMQRAQRLDRPLAILLADLDHFKSVNDRWGHTAGDRVLAASARTLARGLGEGALVARLGGEEFLIALPDTTEPDALRAAQRLCDKVACQRMPLPPTLLPNLPAPLPQAVDRQPCRVTVSIGLTLSCGNEPPDHALKRADSALYQAKHAGRNRVHLSSHEAPSATVVGAVNLMRR